MGHIQRRCCRYTDPIINISIKGGDLAGNALLTCYEGIQVAIALILAMSSLGNHSFRQFWETRKVIRILSSPMSQENRNELCLLFEKLIRTPEEVHYWVSNPNLSAVKNKNIPADLLLKNLFRGWSLVKNKEKFIHLKDDKSFLDLNISEKTFVIDCLRFQGAVEELGSLMTVPRQIARLASELEEASKRFSIRMQEMRTLSFWNNRMLFFHSRDAFTNFSIRSQIASLADPLGKIFLKYLHVSFAWVDPRHKTVYNRHVSYQQYQQNSVHDVELLGSDIVELDASKMIVPEKQKLLSRALCCTTKKELAKVLNERFEKKLLGFQNEALKNGIKNNFWVRCKTLIVFPWSRRNMVDLPLKGGLQCSHFVLLVVEKSLAALDKECRELLQTNEPCIRRLSRPRTNPASISPSKLRQMIEPMASYVKLAV
jgi:hypothetical protein